MNKDKLVDLEKLKKILSEVVAVFGKYDLNTVEIQFVVSELVRINRSFDVIQDRKLEKDL